MALPQHREMCAGNRLATGRQQATQDRQRIAALHAHGNAEGHDGRGAERLEAR